MPYGRRSRLNRRPRRQFRGVVRTRKFRSSVRRVVRRMAESKFNTRDLNNATINNVPIFLTWGDGLTQGTGANDRIGRNVQVNTLSLKLWLTTVVAPNGVTRAGFRLLVLYPRKSVDDETVQNEINNLSLYNRPDPSTVMILWEKRGYLGTGFEGDTSIPSGKVFKFIKKRSKYQFNYDAAGDVKREPIFCAVSNIPPIHPTSMFLNGYISMSFKDI